MSCRQKTKRSVLRNLAVDHRHEFVTAGGLVETRIQILEQPPSDIAEHIQLIERAGGKNKPLFVAVLQIS
jgi:hypothetical protein